MPTRLTTLLLSLLWLLPLTAQDYAGRWKGAIELPGTKLELAIDLSQKDGKWIGDMDIPLQQIKDMALADLVIESGSMKFKLPEVPGNASFLGNFKNNASLLEGDFTQMGQTFAMRLEKEDEVAKREAKARQDKAIATLLQLADSLRQKQQVPGIGIGIIQDGKIALAGGVGQRDAEKNLPVTAQTLFAIGSSSKAFTAMGLGLLVDDGKLEWDKPVIQYMPDFQLYDEFATKEMTAVDLVTHQSGLPRHDLMWYGSSFSRQEIYNRLRFLPPNKSFRSTWQYQNLMYMTAGVLIERLSGKSWEEFTRERIFKPLGMANSVFSVKEVPKTAETALPYRKDGDKAERIPNREIAAVGPAGSIHSNVNDMLKWVQMHLDAGKVNGQAFIGADAINKMHHPHKVIESSESPEFPEFSARSYGLGWFVYNRGDMKVVQHGGNIDGFSAYVYMLPKQQIGMVFLTNRDGTGLPGVLANYATDLLLDKPYTDWYTKAFGDESKKEEEKKDEESKKKKPVPGTTPSHALKDYAGKYEHPGYGIMEVKMVGDSLHMAFNSFDATLRHWHYDVFNAFIKELESDVLVNFYNNKDGVIEKLSAPMEPSMPEDVVFTKLPPDLLNDDKYIASISGAYELESATCTVEKKGAKLYVTLVGQPPYELTPYRDNEFKLKDLNGFSLVFYFENGAEKASAAEFHQPNGVFKAVRK